MTLSRTIPATTLMMILASPCFAAPQHAFSDKLQQDAMSCVGEGKTAAKPMSGDRHSHRTSHEYP